MTSCDADEAGADSLSRLTALASDPVRAERVRVRCRAQLERSRRRAEGTAMITGFAWRVLAPVLVGAVCLFYAAVLVTTTLRLGAVFH